MIGRRQYVLVSRETAMKFQKSLDSFSHVAQSLVVNVTCRKQSVCNLFVCGVFCLVSERNVLGIVFFGFGRRRFALATLACGSVGGVFALFCQGVSILKVKFVFFMAQSPVIGKLSVAPNPFELQLTYLNGCIIVEIPVRLIGSKLVVTVH